MKTIVAGSRTINDYDIVDKAIKNAAWPITEIVSGGAKGVDTLAIQVALAREMPFKVFPVTPLMWKLSGRAAGPMRNKKMAEYADALIAIWDGQSAGTRNMISEAQYRGLKVQIIPWNSTS